MKDIPKSKRYALGWYHEGITHLSINEYEEAIAFFDKALTVIPDHPDFLIGKGDVHFAMGRFDEAFQLYQQATRLDPDSFRAWLRSGIALLKMGRYGEALDILTRIRPMNEYDGELWLAHGIALSHLGRKEEAAESLRNAMRLKPNQPALWYYLSLLEPDHEQALRLLLRGYRIDSTNLDIILEIARRLMETGHHRDARVFCEKARTLDPENRKAASFLSQCRE
ncbi:MAG: tetratricopeptide repeat protein [Methanomicrobiales archaeon]|nr:tetratricopeptide repeat protein [Methanomicrobiales archaeon]